MPLFTSKSCDRLPPAPGSAQLIIQLPSAPQPLISLHVFGALSIVHEIAASTVKLREMGEKVQDGQ